MKKTINGKRYDSDRCEELGGRDHYNNNNYSGTTHLMRANDGTLLVYCDTNGQDLWLRDYMCLLTDTEYTIDDFALSDEQEARCVELGLITRV